MWFGGGGSFTISSVNIAEHEDLRRRYGWRDEFPWDVPTWKDVARAAVGQDYVMRLKTDGTAISAGFSGYFHQFDAPWNSHGPVVAVTAGQKNVLALCANGTTLNAIGFVSDELEQWRDITAIAMGPGTTSA